MQTKTAFFENRMLGIRRKVWTSMKKYMVLLILTGMTMGLLQGVNQYIRSIPIAAVFTAVETDTKRFIKCVGTIEEEGVEELYTDFLLQAVSYGKKQRDKPFPDAFRTL